MYISPNFLGCKLVKYWYIFFSSQPKHEIDKIIKICYINLDVLRDISLGKVNYKEQNKNNGLFFHH